MTVARSRDPSGQPLAQDALVVFLLVSYSVQRALRGPGPARRRAGSPPQSRTGAADHLAGRPDRGPGPRHHLVSRGRARYPPPTPSGRAPPRRGRPSGIPPGQGSSAICQPVRCRAHSPRPSGASVTPCHAMRYSLRPISRRPGRLRPAGHARAEHGVGSSPRLRGGSAARGKRCGDCYVSQARVLRRRWLCGRGVRRSRAGLVRRRPKRRVCGGAGRCGRVRGREHNRSGTLAVAWRPSGC